MLLKLGVDISKLKRPMRRALNLIDQAFKDFGEEAVITSTYEGDHMPSSLHYAHLAVDVRLPRGNVDAVVNALKLLLGKDYDIVVEKDHIHIEYDPKR
ncbi:MAG: hypothetical protein DRH57_04840 [Candidatus Cloacimonadota bacterium]|nr:MAG: hypothetical protein DRH57_04840 [Candidatus Cloacimonadota bacterium]